MSNKVIFITGGARSGKSAYAQQIAANMGRSVLFCATAEALDEEMRNRITAHKKSRPLSWDTLEAPLDVSAALQKLDKEYDTVLIDCITLLVTNCFSAAGDVNQAEEHVFTEIEPLINHLQKRGSNYILVSNEVGCGIVPENRLARIFRDVLGKVNQQMAKSADEVYLMTAGLPLKIK